MKIGIVTDTYRPRINGVVTSIDTFANEFRKLGHQVHIFAPDFPGAKEEEFVYRFPSLPLFFDPEDRLPIPWNKKIFNQIKEIKLDLIHTQTPFSLGIAALKWAKRLNLPVVHTYHTLFESYVHYLPLIPKPIAVQWARRFSRWYCNKCQMIITPSPQMKESIIKYGVNVPIEVNPTGIKIDKFNQYDGNAFRTKFGIDSDETMLLFMGRVGKEKNIDFLLKVLEKLIPEYTKIRLVIAGEGPAKEDLVLQTKKMGLEEKVLFLGYFTPTDWVNCYAAANLFTFASITETQGLVVTEAMAVGTPVVAVGEMGVADVMQGNKGGLLTRLDVDEFVAAVKELLRNQPLYQDKRKEAISWAREWSSESMAKKMILNYEKVLPKDTQ